MIETQKIAINNPISEYETFLNTFEEIIPSQPVPPIDIKPVYKYRKLIDEAYTQAKNETILTILFEDLILFEPALAQFTAQSPEEAIKSLTEAFKNILRIAGGGEIDLHLVYSVRIVTKNNNLEVKLAHVRAKHLGHLIFVKGIITRASRVYQQAVIGAFECPACGNIMQIPQANSTQLKAPRQCSNPNCSNTRDFTFNEQNSEFINQRLIIVQEAPEELRPGSMPGTLEVYLNNGLVEGARAGERVKIMGILTTKEREDKRGRPTTSFYPQLIANSIERDQQDETGELDECDRLQIEALANDPKIQSKIADAIAPVILGSEHLKLAAALSLFGGIQKNVPGGSRIRGDIHVLFMGDPGTGKSQILQACAQIAPRGIYASGKGTSAAGLTAAVIKEEKIGLQLEAGALVLASGGIAAIDEFDKMEKNDRNAMHECMEQGTVSIAKAGIIATLQCQTAIIAAANPKSGRYDDYMTPSENINLPPPILTRFDLLFVVKDRPEKNMDDRIASHILESHMNANSPQGLNNAAPSPTGELPPPQGKTSESESDPTTADSPSLTTSRSPSIPVALLKKYIYHARRVCFPKLTPVVAKKIKEFYVQRRTGTTDGIGDVSQVLLVARNLDGIVRMCEAYAKMALRPTILESDVDAIIALMNHSLHDIGFDPATNKMDMDRLLLGESTKKRQNIQLLFSQIQDLSNANLNSPISYDDIWDLAARITGMTETLVKDCLENWVKDGVLHRPKGHPEEYRLPAKKTKK